MSWPRVEIGPIGQSEMDALWRSAFAAEQRASQWVAPDRVVLPPVGIDVLAPDRCVLCDSPVTGRTRLRSTRRFVVPREQRLVSSSGPIRKYQVNRPMLQMQPPAGQYRGRKAHPSPPQR